MKKKLIEKLEKVKKAYAHWDKSGKGVPVSSDCSDIGSQCHGDGQCGGDGE